MGSPRHVRDPDRGTTRPSLGSDLRPPGFGGGTRRRRGQRQMRHVTTGLVTGGMLLALLGSAPAATAEPAPVVAASSASTAAGRCDHGRVPRPAADQGRGHPLRCGHHQGQARTGSDQGRAGHRPRWRPPDRRGRGGAARHCHQGEPDHLAHRVPRGRPSPRGAGAVRRAGRDRDDNGDGPAEPQGHGPGPQQGGQRPRRGRGARLVRDSVRSRSRWAVAHRRGPPGRRSDDPEEQEGSHCRGRRPRWRTGHRGEARSSCRSRPPRRAGRSP